MLEYLYLGNSRLQNTGAKVILNSLNKKKSFKALGLNDNSLSKDIVNSTVQFVTNHPELEEFLLNHNFIGTAGIIKICNCMKNINQLKILKLADNNVSDVAAEALVSLS